MLHRIVNIATVLMVFLFGVNSYLLLSETFFSSGKIENGGLISQAHAVPEKGAAISDLTTSQNLSGEDHCVIQGSCVGKPQASLTGSQKLLVKDINARMQDLELREKKLAAQQQLLDAANIAFRQKVDDAAKASADIGKQNSALSSEETSRLVSIYQTMKPIDAAAIFNVLDLRVCVTLLQHMPTRHASAIMEAMSPQRAILATQMLVGHQPSLLPVATNGG
ncbi:hypothetical protein AA101099_2143 [Neoasaia chiangmaiensis NBRC 101099]|uniref:Uncharacterized protein n=1 Tax=Neoasaia chiangmaiensis TaxID=320497 RepID=A0A1U9KT15_9PROT|nr:hypothetical protein [Neoasaia chiangmaiensis]AQS88879.1 hypothetical protein A0U93_14205 [Neoasaia chiangmaiensis]GBR40501.1 hypothetical protein AA101099_2143 [Neoasaia chiangmaiensis NBRC 101099]GEN13869.1 hypothetical protein NCH01_03000 [Neoasaia chiangmaiensis]